ncbi:hypothetical protein BOTBODRAFT_33311 [Botryobasidium botryosum FD-172 SS1]|uniref:Uncharacterized protein n=1 Tax=Botryobasidium botryosum (strain FD-172 SS1) TaxID=930990 RepID=A0A067MPV6_BOTB1|nr:hypothetical protein BOTBODRAFT_33311 [Botryobasidium botryosum FD-172 SS1]
MANKFNALQDGLYYIRSISTADPNPGIGGSYVTASGPGQDLLAVPGVEKQAVRIPANLVIIELRSKFPSQWAVEKNKDSDLYTIRYVDNGSVSQDLGFWYETFEENTRLALHAPGNFTTQLATSFDIASVLSRPGPAPYSTCWLVLRKVILTRLAIFPKCAGSE